MLRKGWYPVILAVGGLVVGFTGTSKADITISSRVTNYTIDVGNAAFDGAAVTNYNFTADYAGNNGDTSDTTLNVKTGAQNINVFPSGDVSLTNLVYDNPNTGIGATYTLNMGPSGTGSVTSQYSVAAGSDFTQSWIVPGVSAGLNTLEFQGDGSESNYNSGYTFTVNIALSGNWTTIGTSTGDIQFLGTLTPGWSMTGFSYDSGTSTTNLVYQTTNYQDGTSAGIDFLLYGSAVPEPSSGVLLLIASCLGVVPALRAVGRGRSRLGVDPAPPADA